jgi:hypothetical protein
MRNRLRSLASAFALLSALLLVSCAAQIPSCPPCPPCPTCPAAGPAQALTAVPSPGEGELDIADMTFNRDSIGNFIVMGIIRNEGHTAVRGIEVSCTAYDSSERLVDTHTTYPELTTLAPGQETTYTCYLDEVSPIDSYKCVVQW